MWTILKALLGHEWEALVAVVMGSAKRVFMFLIQTNVRSIMSFALAANLRIGID